MAYRLVQTLNSDFVNSSIGPQKHKKGRHLRTSNVCLFCLMKFFFPAMAAAANGVLGDYKPGCKGAAHTFVARKRKIVYDTRDEN